MNEEQEYKQRVGSAMIGAGLGVGAGVMSHSSLQNSLMNESSGKKKHFKKVLKSIGKKELDLRSKDNKNSIRGYKTKSGKRVIVYNQKKGRKFSDFIIPDVGHQDVLRSVGIKNKKTLNYAKKHRDDLHFIKSNNNATSLLHELGHAKGYGKYRLPLGRYSPSVYTSAAIPVTGVLTSKRAGESEQDYRSRVGRNIAIATGAGIGLSTPRMLEEARASRNAIRIGKKINVKPNKPALYKAFGTYASKGLIMPAVAGLGTYGAFLANRKGQEKTSSLKHVEQAKKNAESRYKQHKVKNFIKALAVGGVGAGVAHSIPRSAHAASNSAEMQILAALLASGLYTHLNKLSEEDRKKILLEEIRKLKSK
jgi:hypothetical protein